MGQAAQPSVVAGDVQFDRHNLERLALDVTYHTSIIPQNMFP